MPISRGGALGHSAKRWLWPSDLRPGRGRGFSAALLSLSRFNDDGTEQIQKSPAVDDAGEKARHPPVSVAAGRQQGQHPTATHENCSGQPIRTHRLVGSCAAAAALRQQQQARSKTTHCSSVAESASPLVSPPWSYSPCSVQNFI